MLIVKVQLSEKLAWLLEKSAQFFLTYGCTSLFIWLCFSYSFEMINSLSFLRPPWLIQIHPHSFFSEDYTVRVEMAVAACWYQREEHYHTKQGRSGEVSLLDCDNQAIKGVWRVGLVRLQYAPSLNFRTCHFAYWGESHVAINIYPNRVSIIGTLRSNEAMTQEHLKNNGLVIILNKVYPV